MAAAPAPRSPGSIDRVLQEVEATLGPLLPAVDGPGPQEAAPPATGVVATPCALAAEMLGPLIAPGFRFLKLLIVVDAWSFDSLRLPDVVRRVIYAPGASSGEVVLVEQSRPELLWPVDIILRAGDNAVFSGRWRAFALGHRLRVGDHLRVGNHLVFCFKLGTLEASVRIFAATGVRRTYPQPVAQ
jgi:hypothetical protein